jgi:hypothetical protein
MLLRLLSPAFIILQHVQTLCALDYTLLIANTPYTSFELLLQKHR